MEISKKNYVHLEGGSFARGQYTKKDFEDLFKAFRADVNKNLLVVHFHGGLVSFNKGLEISAHLEQYYKPAGAYPVFFLWESHPWETFLNYLKKIFRGTLFQSMSYNIHRFDASLKKQPPDQRGRRLELISGSEIWEELDLLEKHRVSYTKIEEPRMRDEVILSEAQKQQFKELLYRDTNFRDEIKNIAEDVFPLLREEFPLRSLKAPFMSDNILSVTRQKERQEMEEALFERIAEGGIAVIERIFKRFRDGRDHGYHATFVEEMLREFSVGNIEMKIWERMKKDIADSFEQKKNEETQEYGGTAFLEELRKGWEDGHRPRIVLVGHSAGAIYICRWLEAAEKMQLPVDIKFDIVFLAPACAFDLFADTMRNFHKRIKNFRMFGMEDELEKEDKILLGLYPRSLLYIVCGALEEEADKPLVGMQRFHSRQPPFDPGSDKNLKEVFDYLDTDADKMVWSEEDRGDGLKSHSKTHGDFDDDITTLESIAHILRFGYKTNKMFKD